MNSFVKVLYGPYEAHGIIQHKVQKVYGLISYLKENNIEFEALPSPHLNRLTIEMNERIIYTCDIRYLKFNLPLDDDILCQRIVNVINTHKSTFSTTKNVPKFVHVSEGLRWLRLQATSESTFHEDSLSLDYLDLDVPCNSFARSAMEAGEGEEGEENYYDDELKLIEAARRQQYAYDYGPFMQEQPPYESEQESSLSTIIPETKDESVSSSSGTSSCVCLAIDPPSLYSICYGPPTPFNTEISQVKIDSTIRQHDEKLDDVDDVLAEAEGSDTVKCALEEAIQDDLDDLWAEILQPVDGSGSARIDEDEGKEENSDSDTEQDKIDEIEELDLHIDEAETVKAIKETLSDDSPLARRDSTRSGLRSQHGDVRVSDDDGDLGYLDDGITGMYNTGFLSDSEHDDSSVIKSEDNVTDESNTYPASSATQFANKIDTYGDAYKEKEQREAVETVIDRNRRPKVCNVWLTGGKCNAKK